MTVFNSEDHDKKGEIFFERLPIDSAVLFKEYWDLNFSFSGIGINQGATCEDCEQFLKGCCAGGYVPEHCIQTMVDNTKIVIIEKP